MFLTITVGMSLFLTSVLGQTAVQGSTPFMGFLAQGSNVTAGQTVPFRIYVNGIDTGSNGVFTVPADGAYSIQLSWTQDDTEYEVALSRNNVYVGPLSKQTQEKTYTGGNTYTVRLIANDQVYVKSLKQKSIPPYYFAFTGQYYSP